MILPDNFSPQEREERAKSLFRNGYNCCQSVLLAFADVLELNEKAKSEILSVIGSGFGGGMGRMREVCGGFSAMVMMAGFIAPAQDPSAKAARTVNYAMVQDFARQFKDLNGGSIICGELLGITKRHVTENPEPSDRTPEYYKKRPCEQIVGTAAHIVAEKLMSMD